MTIQKKIGLMIVSALAILFYCYTQGPVPFSKIHINLPFLNFPIFIGEIMLFICLILVITKLVLEPPKWNRAYALPALFFIFVLLKTVWGYWYWGPLALRNAALFYYSLFAGIIYFSIDWSVYQRKSLFYVLLPILFFLFLFQVVGIDYYFTYTIFGVCLCLTLRNTKARYIIFVLYLFLIGINFETGSRGILVSIFLSLFFLFCAYIFYFLKLKTKHKIGILTSISCLMIIVIAIGGDKNAVKSLTFVNEYIKNYRQMTMVAETNKDVELPRVAVKIYHSKDPSEQQQSTIMQPPLSSSQIQTIVDALNQKMSVLEQMGENIWDKEDANQKQAQLTREQLNSINGYLRIIENRIKEHDQLIKDSSPEDKRRLQELKQRLVQSKQQIEELEGRVKSSKTKYRSLNTAKGNVMWRIFVWKDMLVDLWNSKNPIGLDFGYPFRSRSLEIISIVNEEDWSRGHWVGWIEPHNSFIHILYRFGILGLAYIFFMWGAVIKMMVDFARVKNLKGVLLVTAVVYWLFMANFAVILELPYFAIPFWCLFGFVYKYYQESKCELRDG